MLDYTDTDGGVTAREMLGSVSPVSPRLTALQAAEPREMSKLEFANSVRIKIHPFTFSRIPPGTALSWLSASAPGRIRFHRWPVPDWVI